MSAPEFRAPQPPASSSTNNNNNSGNTSQGVNQGSAAPLLGKKASSIHSLLLQGRLV